MKINLQKNKTFFLLFFIFSFFSFSSIAKPADVINYSAFLPVTNNSNFINASSYYNPADFSGQNFPLITEDIPCVDINHNIGPGTKDYIVFGPILKLQMYLYQNEYMKYPPTGLYLQYTYDGVRNFQRDNGLRETGIVDTSTRAALKQATCQTKNNIITQVVNPIPTPIITPIITPVIPSPIINPPIIPTTYFYCPLNNIYYNSQTDLSINCVNNNPVTYTVSYHNNGADSGSPSVMTQSVNVGGSLTTTSQGTLVKSGYSFAGWSTSPSGTPLISANSSYTPTADVTLYAIWNYIGSNNNLTNNLINTVNIGDNIGSFYLSSSLPVASNILVNFTYNSCAKVYLCTQKSGQAYMYIGSTKSTTISTNYNGETIKNPTVNSISPASDSNYTYIH